MTERLNHKQTAAMFTLMVLAKAVSNTELKEAVGFTLDGQDRVRLNDLKLVDSRREGNRPFTHELTERGWAWCGEELGARTPPPPHPRSTLVPALYAMLAGFAEYLGQSGLRLVDVFGQPADLEHRIRAAYRKLTAAPGEWARLAELRPLLNGAPAKAVDEALQELSRSGRAHLIPESDRKALTGEDHEAAVRLGGEDNHLLALEEW
ncbi:MULTISPECIES: hypothetical protein [Amycolatopsis]|uniref:Uncharacterized protein n=2 Tax=Amycolatopsis TaxID=1813 RepID=A0A1I3VM43_9PSEU|nr:hypothetical protein [Amycolatopsis sacchari]SFJ96053.1 hypothetical protein SAMN05421835_11190 [Amycolatopsis sacchari]